MAKKAQATKSAAKPGESVEKPKVKKPLTVAQKLKKAEAALKRVLNIIK
jgi:hypothetical protein